MSQSARNPFDSLANFLEKIWNTYRPGHPRSEVERAVLRVKGMEIRSESFRLVQEADAAARAAGLPDGEVWPTLAKAQELVHQRFFGTRRGARPGTDDDVRVVLRDLRALAARLAEAAAPPPPPAARRGKPGRRSYPSDLLAYVNDLLKEDPARTMAAVRKLCVARFGKERVPISVDAFKRWLRRQRTN
jgi:hypothetical protein